VYFIQCLSRARNVDAIFAQDSVSVGLPSLVAAKLLGKNLGKNFFLRLGGDYAWEQGRLRFGVTETLEEFARARGRYPFLVRAFKRIQTYVASSAYRVTVQSAFMKKVVVCWGVSEEKIIVIPNGFSSDSIVMDRTSAREILGLSGTIGVSAGRLVPWKGFAELIKIVPDILKHIPDFVLYIIGDGPEEEKLRELVEERALAQKVIFTGRLEKEKLMRYLAVADVFVLNTEYEGFSNQLLEVYSVGTPIVTTDIAGNHEVVTDGVSGVLVPPRDGIALTEAILKVLENKAFAEKLAAGGKEKLREFSVERAISSTDAFLS
jgi:glycosyltransferase involved in cell wall biosynthesis